MPLFRRRSSSQGGAPRTPVLAAPPALPALALPDVALGSIAPGAAGVATPPLPSLATASFADAAHAESMPRSRTVPQFHRPWTREGYEGRSSMSTTGGASTPPIGVRSPYTSPVRSGPPPSSFRTSSFTTSPPPPPAQAKRAAEIARAASLRRIRAPPALQILVAGARGTGKTSWLHALLRACAEDGVDVDGELQCPWLARRAADMACADALFTPGLPPSPLHRNRLVHPPVPLRTAVMQTLGTLTLRSAQANARRMSVVSSASGSTGGSARLTLHLSDSPGLRFDTAAWETERALRSLLHALDSRMARRMAEEGRVERTAAGTGARSRAATRSGDGTDGVVDVIVYFVDALSLVRRRPRPRAAPAAAATQQTDAAAALGLQFDGPALLGLADSASPVTSQAVLEPAAPFDEQDDDDADDEDADDAELCIAPRELGAMARLAERAALVPVLARADLLSEHARKEALAAVHTSMQRAGINLEWAGQSLEPSEELDDASARGTERPKLIRLRSRRSYSGSQAGITSGAVLQRSYSAASSTADVFSDDPAPSPPKLSLPLCIFTPDSVPLPLGRAGAPTLRRTGSNSSVSSASRPRSLSHGGRSASASSALVPPVPPLPVGLSPTASPDPGARSNGNGNGSAHGHGNGNGNSAPPASSSGTATSVPSSSLRPLSAAETAALQRARREAEAERLQRELEPRWVRSYAWGEADVRDP
jgi:septin family protein